MPGVELKENDRNGTEDDTSRDARAVNVRRGKTNVYAHGEADIRKTASESTDKMIFQSFWQQDGGVVVGLGSRVGLWGGKVRCNGNEQMRNGRIDCSPSSNI